MFPGVNSSLHHTEDEGAGFIIVMPEHANVGVGTLLVPLALCTLGECCSTEVDRVGEEEAILLLTQTSDKDHTRSADLCCFNDHWFSPMELSDGLWVIKSYTYKA